MTSVKIADEFVVIRRPCDQSSTSQSTSGCTLESKAVAVPLTLGGNRMFGRREGEGHLITTLNADGFWTTNTSSAMATQMTMLPLGDGMFSVFAKVFDEVKLRSVKVTLDFTEYQTLLDKTASAAGRSFAVALSRLDNVARDYTYLQDRRNAKLVSPSAAKRIFFLRQKLNGLVNPSAITIPNNMGWYSTDYLAAGTPTDFIASHLKLATSDTCGVAGIIRARAQFQVEFRCRKGSS